MKFALAEVLNFHFKLNICQEVAEPILSSYQVPVIEPSVNLNAQVLLTEK